MAYKMTIAKDTNALRLVGKGEGVKNHKLSPYKGGTVGSRGTHFEGMVVYVRMPYGFEKLIRIEGTPDVYFPPHAISYREDPTKKAFSGAAGNRKRRGTHGTIEQQRRRGAAMAARMRQERLNRVNAIPRSNPYAIPRAGEIMPFVPRTNRDFVAGGEIEGDMATAPHISDDIYSSFNGNGHGNSKLPYGVQAGQIYLQTNRPNPYQVEAGQVEGVHETDSHVYSDMKGYGLKAGAISQNWMDHDDQFGLEAGMIQGAQPDTQIAPWINASGEKDPRWWIGADGNYVSDGYGDGSNPYGVQAGQVGAKWMRHNDKFGLEAGMIQGAQPDTQIAPWVNAIGDDEYVIDRAYRYPNLLHYHGINPHTLSSLPQYAAGYPQYQFSGADGGRYIFDKGKIYPVPKDFDTYFSGRKDRKESEWEVEFSGAAGDFFKKVFGTKETRDARRKEREIRRAERKKLEDKSEQKVEFTEEEMKELHEQSGSKQPLESWRKSDTARRMAGSLATITSILLGRGQEGDARDTEFEDDDSKKRGSQKRILGMHPITFGIGAVVILTGAIVGIAYFTTRKKKA